MVNIKAVKLRKVFGRVVALDNLNLEISGNIIAIVGPNGSGKTTFLTILSGIRRPTSGKAYINGIEPYSNRWRIYNYITYTFEKPRYNLALRVRDILNILIGKDGLRNILDNYGDDLPLNDIMEKRLYELSSGQSQILSLLISLIIYRDKIAILDEPLSNLDIKYRRVFYDVMKDRGGIIFTTHVIEEAEVLSEKLMIISDGRVRWVGDKRDIFTEGIYEVLVDRDVVDMIYQKLNILADFGTHLLIKLEDMDILYELLNNGSIIGYRRAGLRRWIYAENP